METTDIIRITSVNFVLHFQSTRHFLHLHESLSLIADKLDLS